MEPGYGVGVLVAIVFCGILILCALYESKGTEKKKQRILNELPEDMYNQLANANYEVCSDNANFMYGCSYIYEIIQKDGRVRIGVMYYQPAQNAKKLPYTLDHLFLNQNEYENNKNIVKEGMLIKTVHNRTYMPYKVCKLAYRRNIQ